MRSFKKPLKAEEERYYIKMYRDGDEKAKEKLIEHNLRLVAHIVKKYNSPDRDLDDLISIGTIGLIKAVNTFDLNKGGRLVTYAARCIAVSYTHLDVYKRQLKSKDALNLEPSVAVAVTFTVFLPAFLPGFNTPSFVTVTIPSLLQLHLSFVFVALDGSWLIFNCMV